MPLLENTNHRRAGRIECALGNAVIVGTTIGYGIARQHADSAVFLNAGRSVWAFGLGGATLHTTSPWKVGIHDTCRAFGAGSRGAAARGAASSNDVALFPNVGRVATAR